MIHERQFQSSLAIRDEGDGRTLVGPVLPWGVSARVLDRGRLVTETFERGALADAFRDDEERRRVFPRLADRAVRHLDPGGVQIGHDGADADLLAARDARVRVRDGHRDGSGRQHSGGLRSDLFSPGRSSVPQTNVKTALG